MLQNLIQALLVQITQCDDSFAVQTAGDDGAVAENADLIPESVAGSSRTIVGGAGQRRPIEAFTPLQVETIADFIAVMMLDPLFGKDLLQCGENVVVVLMM